MAFQKGKSGNPGGGLKDKAFADAVRIAVSRKAEDGRRKLMLLADKLIDCALSGEGWAMQQIADRLDGKPAQESTVTIFRDVNELTDSEIAARIAELRGTDSSDGDNAPSIDPARLN